MRVLVTGAAGFIGGRLAARLAWLGHEVTCVDKRTGLSTADRVGFARMVAAARPDVIAHLGANCSTPGSLRDPAGDFDDNAVGTVNVCEAATRRDLIPVLLMSTVKVQPGVDGRLAPLGLSKQVGEQYVRGYGDLYGMPWVINRPSTVYGPGQDATADAGWFTWFTKASLTGEQIMVAGDGTQSRDVLYIDDMVNLLVDQVTHFDRYAGRAYDVGGGLDNEVSLTQLLAELGHTNVTHVDRRPADLQCVVTDNTAVTAVNGWHPRTGWRDGLARTLEHLKREVSR